MISSHYSGEPFDSLLITDTSKSFTYVINFNTCNLFNDSIDANLKISPKHLNYRLIIAFTKISCSVL